MSDANTSIQRSNFVPVTCKCCQRVLVKEEGVPRILIGPATKVKLEFDPVFLKQEPIDSDSSSSKNDIISAKRGGEKISFDANTNATHSITNKNENGSQPNSQNAVVAKPRNEFIRPHTTPNNFRHNRGWHKPNYYRSNNFYPQHNPYQYHRQGNQFHRPHNYVNKFGGNQYNNGNFRKNVNNFYRGNNFRRNYQRNDDRSVAGRSQSNNFLCIENNATQVSFQNSGALENDHAGPSSSNVQTLRHSFIPDPDSSSINASSDSHLNISINEKIKVPLRTPSASSFGSLASATLSEIVARKSGTLTAGDKNSRNDQLLSVRGTNCIDDDNKDDVSDCELDDAIVAVKAICSRCLHPSAKESNEDISEEDIQILYNSCDIQVCSEEGSHLPRKGRPSAVQSIDISPHPVFYVDERDSPSKNLPPDTDDMSAENCEVAAVSLATNGAVATDVTDPEYNPTFDDDYECDVHSLPENPLVIDDLVDDPVEILVLDNQAQDEVMEINAQGDDFSCVAEKIPELQANISHVANNLHPDLEECGEDIILADVPDEGSKNQSGNDAGKEQMPRQIERMNDQVDRLENDDNEIEIINELKSTGSSEYACSNAGRICDEMTKEIADVGEVINITSILSQPKSPGAHFHLKDGNEVHETDLDLNDQFLYETVSLSNNSNPSSKPSTAFKNIAEDIDSDTEVHLSIVVSNEFDVEIEKDDVVALPRTARRISRSNSNITEIVPSTGKDIQVNRMNPSNLLLNSEKTSATSSSVRRSRRLNRVTEELPTNKREFSHVELEEETSPVEITDASNPAKTSREVIDITDEVEVLGGILPTVCATPIPDVIKASNSTIKNNLLILNPCSNTSKSSVADLTTIPMSAVKKLIQRKLVRRSADRVDAVSKLLVDIDSSSPGVRRSRRFVTASSAMNSPAKRVSEITASSAVNSPANRVSEITASSAVNSPAKRVSGITASSAVNSPAKRVSEITESSAVNSPAKRVSEIQSTSASPTKIPTKRTRVEIERVRLEKSTLEKPTPAPEEDPADCEGAHTPRTSVIEELLANVEDDSEYKMLDELETGIEKKVEAIHDEDDEVMWID